MRRFGEQLDVTLILQLGRHSPPRLNPATLRDSPCECDSRRRIKAATLTLHPPVNSKLNLNLNLNWNRNLNLNFNLNLNLKL
jgi:hypothetical protein